MRFIPFFAALLVAAQAGAQTSTTLDVPIVVTHAGSPVQTLLPMVQQGLKGTPFQFLAGAGSANGTVGKIIPAAIFPALPAFAGTYSISGADAGKFAINPATGVVTVCNAAPSCADLPAGNYNITISVSQPGVVGSPTSTPVVLQGVDIADTTTPYLHIDDYAPAPGATITVTVRNAPNVSGNDYIEIDPTQHGYANTELPSAGNSPYTAYIGPVGKHNGSYTLTIPDPPTDNYQWLTVLLIPNYSVPSQSIATTSDLLISPRTVFVMPTAPNTLTPPFTPAQTLTVCPSGCQYPELSAAIIGLSNANIGVSPIPDNVLITMQTGAYLDCIMFGNGSPFSAPTRDGSWHLPQHLWIKGVGGGFAHISAMDNPNYNCFGKGVITFWGGGSGSTIDMVTIDNMEISDFSLFGALYEGLGHMTARNVYIHDGATGMITGNNGGPYNFVLQNVDFARLGGTAGPSHGTYFGDNALNVSIDHSLFEQVNSGHEVKSRAASTTLTCNQLRGSQDPYYVDSEEIDCAEGRTCIINNNTIVKGAGSVQQNQIGWMQDFESGFVPGITWQLNLNNNIVIDDLNDQHWFVYIGPSVIGNPSAITSPPNTWTNNIMVGGNLGGTDPYGSYPFYSYHAANGTTNIQGYPDPSQVTELGDVRYPNRAAAGITTQFPPPPGCTGTIGNMAVP
jgi:hypothetical protein